MNPIELIKQSAPHQKDSSIENIQKFITSNPEVMDGLPVFSGTRIPVYIVLDYLSEGMTTDDILKDYPSLTQNQIRIALKFAEQLTSLH